MSLSLRIGRTVCQPEVCVFDAAAPDLFITVGD
jgi:hypothetical protein